MTKYIYKGNGGHLIGLPARDMSEDEFEAYPEELQQAAFDAGLYELEIDKPKPKKEVKDA